MSLSIDIGKKNLGYSILLNKKSEENEDIDNQINIAENNLIFGIFNIEDEIHNKFKNSNGIVIKRIAVLNNFLTRLIEENHVEKVIIERQVQTNTIAMELMYAIVSLCITKVDMENIIIYDPKKKFTDLNLSYSTKNKEHKKLSVNVCEKYINELYPDKINEFNEYSKKDDISDSILMNLLVNKKI